MGSAWLLLLLICGVGWGPANGTLPASLPPRGARYLFGQMNYPTKPFLPITKVTGGGGNDVDDHNYIHNYVLTDGVFVHLPFMAMVSLRNANDNHICAGTLISTQVVLSAAHCFNRNNEAGIPETADIGRIKRVGRDKFFSEKHNITSHVIHEAFNSRTFDFDAALVLLERPTLYPTVELATNTYCFERFGGCDLQLLGWGKLSYDKGLADYLQRYSPPILTRRECQEHHQATPITENMLCAGNITNGGIGSCSGDSGGPAFVVEHGIYKQVGIISWTYGCADSYTPEVFTSIPSLYSWIMPYLESPRKFDLFNP